MSGYPGGTEPLTVTLTAEQWDEVLTSLRTERSEYGDDDGLIASTIGEIVKQIGEQ